VEFVLCYECNSHISWWIAIFGIALPPFMQILMECLAK
jgi:hypothetical protein